MKRPPPLPSRARAAARTLVVLGHVGPASKAMTDFAIELGRVSGLDVAVTAVSSYLDAARLIHDGQIDVAWLAPVPFLSLVLQSRVVPLASIRGAAYQSAIVVRASSSLHTPKSLFGWRAAWVDPYSAAGFIVPRIQLARLGVDPRSAFTKESFAGTHEGVIASILAGEADFGATYAWKDRQGTLRGPWSEMKAPVRVLAMFGSIPPDVIAARATLGKPIRKAIVRGLKRLMILPSARPILAAVFGSVGFCRPDMAAYERLREAALAAYRGGLLQIDRPDPLDVAKTLELRPVLPSSTDWSGRRLSAAT